MNPINPRPFLDEVTGRWVSVKLKWGWELRGILKSSDAYMNLHVFIIYIFKILNSEEWVNGENRGSLGEILIRLIITIFIDATMYYILDRCQMMHEINIVNIYQLTI